MADLPESVFDSPVIMWSGLGSGTMPGFWEPLHEMQRKISGAALIKSNSGFGHWEDVAQYIVDTGQRKVLIGHSNGGYAITKVAEAIGEIPCDIICLDRTLKSCPRVDNNVKRCVEIWFGLAKLNFVSNYHGEYSFYDFHHETHIGGISNPEVQDTVVNFANAWKE